MRINVIINPREDRAFREMVEQTMSSGAREPGELQLALRSVFTAAVVVIGVEQAGGERWYAYRDGRWISTLEGAQ